MSISIDLIERIATGLRILPEELFRLPKEDDLRVKKIELNLKPGRKFKLDSVDILKKKGRK